MPEKTSKSPRQFRLPLSLACSFLFSSLLQLNVQAQDCERIAVEQPGDTYIVEVDPDTFWVRVEPDEFGIDRTQRSSHCLSVSRAGYYRVIAAVEYSENQFNETFFVTVKNASGAPETSVPVCDPNAGQYKVIQDDMPSELEADPGKATRDAGLFYFEAGLDTIVLNHYYLIQRDHPEFVNPPGALIDPEDAESVHISHFELIFVQPLFDPVDLRLENIASHDAVKLGQKLTYTLRLHNQSETAAQSIVVTDSLPQYFILDEQSITPAPNLIDERILQWDFETLAESDTISISFSGTVYTDNRETGNLSLNNQAFVKSLCDTNYANSSTATSTPIQEVEDLADLSISQEVQSDSFSVADGDTSWYVAAGELYQYTLHVRNTSSTPALDITIADVLPDSVRSPLATEDTLTWFFPALDAGDEIGIVVPAMLSASFPDTVVELSNLASVNSVNEDSTKLQDNNSILDILTYKSGEPNAGLSNIAVLQSVRTDSFLVSASDTSWYVRPGETYDYDVTVRNLSLLAADTISINASISEWATFTGSASDTLEITLNSLPAQSDTVLHFQAMLPSTLPDTAKAFQHLLSARAANEDSLLLTDNASILPVFIYSIDDTSGTDSTDIRLYQSVQTDSFVVTNSDTLWFVRPGESFTWTLVAENLTPTLAENVFIRDVVPDYITAGSSVSGDTLQWNVGTIAGLSDTTISFVARVADLLPDSLDRIINVADITASNEIASLSDNTSIDTVYLLRPDLAADSSDVTISQTARTDSFTVNSNDTTWFARAGETIAYSVKVSNLSETNADGVVVMATSGDSLALIGASANALRWQVASLPASSDTTFSYEAMVAPTMPPGLNLLITRAEVSAANEQSSFSFNNSAIDTVFNYVAGDTTAMPDLAVSQYVQTPDFRVSDGDTTWLLKEDEIAAFTVTISNLSDHRAQNVALQYLLADSLRIEPAQNTGADTLTWQIGELAGLADTTLSFRARLAPSMPAGSNWLVNQAIVIADNEPQNRLSNNTAEVQILNEVTGTSEDYADLAIGQFVRTARFETSGTDTTWFVEAGETFTYSIRVENQVDRLANRVEVAAALPDSVRAVGYPSTQDTLTWQIGNLPGLSSATLSYDVELAPIMPEGRNMLVSQASVVATNEHATTLDDNVTTTTVVNEVTVINPVFADLEVWQYVRTDSFSVAGFDTTWFARSGETYQYFIHLRNNENAVAGNVVIKDLPPDSVSIAGSLMSVGDSLLWELGDLGALADTTVVLSVTVSEHIRYGQVELINTVFVDADNEDQSKLSNNVSISAGVVFAIPVREPSETCDVFALNYNVYEPERSPDPLLMSFELEASKEVQIDVYDVSGYQIDTITRGFFNAGPNDITWNAVTQNGMKVGSGVYLITMRANGISCWKKVIITR